ncbi:asparagine synthase (glutamine-hydrolyzing) [Candidatus Parcubacteria bacterium]|nr:asparagine synthase (glutamine-hydrolyzing) [Candidatus Parcubacteria bacterium]
MCGIAGFNWEDREKALKMGKCIKHRGPDAEGVFSEEVTLVHKRLAIIDLSPAANQPMFDTEKKLVIIFNGEIYNYKELRIELQDKYNFVTQSDTEVILAGYKVWGSDVVNYLNGIFALAIWDTENKNLFLARDHMGVKPLYYFWDGERFIFASEVKAILEHDIPRKLNLDSFNKYMRVLYVPEPETMIQGIKKLPPGARINLKGTKLELEKYYEPKLKAEKFNYFNYTEAKDRVREVVTKGIQRQLVSDVPVGVYLSGGIDSSAVLSSVSKVKNNIKTFSIGFDLEDNEEKDKFNKDFELAEASAKHFGADHHPLTISTKEVAENLEDIISTIDDPISNPTAIPMFYLSKFAKKDVTVVLNGNGGDELFGGYDRYKMDRRVDTLGKIPGVKFLLPKKIRNALEMDALDRLVQFEFEKDWRLEKVLNKKFFTPVSQIKRDFRKYLGISKDKTEALMMADLTSWLPDQALILGDKMSMQGSIEERVPLLDREIVELGMSLPLAFKVTPFETKKILKDAFREELPEALFRQPKRGWFSPGAKWLRRPEVLSIAKNVLSEGYYGPTMGLFDWLKVQEMLRNHVEKREYNLTILWAILTFQIWARKYKIEFPNG